MSRLKSTSMDRVHSGQRQCDISSWRISRHPTPPAGHRHGGHGGHGGHMTQVGGHSRHGGHGGHMTRRTHDTADTADMADT